MSAIASSPNTRDNQQSNPITFTNPSFEDPFLPSTSSPEDHLQASDVGLVSIAATQPSFQGHYTTAAGQKNHINSQRNSHSPSGSFSRYQYTNNSDASQLNDSHYTTYSLSASPPAGQDLLSPFDYTSELLSGDPSEQTTPSYEEEFLMTAGFPSMPDIDADGDHIYSDPGIDNFSNDPSNQFDPTVIANVQGDKQHSASYLTASQPQLLSPVLTNTPSPSSEYRNLHTGAVPLVGGSQNTSQPSDMAARRTRADIPPRALQHTPTLTGSSSSSLEPGPLEPIARTASPVVRVSSYSRGDSPARSGGLERTSSRRSRTSGSPGHLSPAQQDSEDEDEDHSSSQHFPTITSLSQGSRAQDGSWIPHESSGQAGLDPKARAEIGDVYVPSIKELEEQRHLKQKNENIKEWMHKSEAGSDAGDDPNALDPERKALAVNFRRRARSMGDPVRINTIGLGIDDMVFDDSSIPGPGVLIDEESGEEDDDDDEASLPESPAADVNTNAVDEEKGYFPDQGEEPLARQFYRSKVWHDQPSEGPQEVKTQPGTSNAAMMRFKQRAENIETASRSATWGTRRLSETDVNKVIGDAGLFKSLSLSRGSKDKSERRGSFLKHAEQAASKLIPKRSNSNMKRKLTETSEHNSSSDSVGKPKRDSLTGGRLPPGLGGNLVPPKRSSSFGRPSKTPPLNTGSAVAAMATSIAAIGASGPLSATSATPTGGPWSHAKVVMRRSRSRSELPRNKVSASPGLAELMTHHGGPPMPTLASPLQEKPPPRSVPAKQADDEDEDDEDEVMGGKGVTMDLKIRTDNITPTYDGFKTNVRQLNPRLAPFLVDRIGTEQLRRYKKLVEFKVKHVHIISTAKCPSGKHCFAQGGEATMLPPRTSAKDPETTYAGFQVSRANSDDETATAFAEGAVTAALFPLGVPLPPVKRLPAEFECSLCFKVKKFQKPSDWTKHVHEDVQPFTCTFPNCAEPKSFKRKADWVRHENERHRQLEWWTCNMPDCSHTCYRKDNFVQHLVREHKKPEPKVKTTGTKTPRGSTNSKARGKTQADYIEEWKSTIPDPGADEVDKVWQLVDACRHDTKKLPRDEACQFCGNVCGSWKKLTVHLAKHMEQIAMPVLELVKQRDVDPDTIISPIEKLQPRKFSGSPDTSSPAVQTKMEPMSVSPYSVPSQFEPHNQMAEPHTLEGYPQYYPTYKSTEEYHQAFSIQQTAMSGYDSSVHSQVEPDYNMTAYPPYASVSPQQLPSQQNSHFITTNAPTAPATYPPPFLPSRSSQVRPGTGYDPSGQQGQVYGSPIDGMQYVYPDNTPIQMQVPPGMSYDVPYSQAGDPSSQGTYHMVPGQGQGQQGGQNGYGYQ